MVHSTLVVSFSHHWVQVIHSESDHIHLAPNRSIQAPYFDIHSRDSVKLSNPVIGILLLACMWPSI